jgi:hypothetical protein
MLYLTVLSSEWIFTCAWRSCRIDSELATLEKQIFDLEGRYLASSAANLVTGWEKFSQ